MVFAPSSLGVVCFSDLEESEPRGVAVGNNLQTSCTCLCLFSCYWTWQDVSRTQAVCFNTLPSSTPHGTLIPTDSEAYLCLLLIPKAIQKST